MPKVADLYDSDSFPVAQKNHILKRVKTALALREDVATVLQHNLGELAWSYSTGGISGGRSLRSVVLDEAIICFDFGFNENTKELIAILLAMYHSEKYINEKRWFDFHVTLTELPIQHRIWLLTVA